MHALSRKALDFVTSHGLLGPSDAVVAGLSGGPDSVALVLVLLELSRSGHLPLAVRLAHLNHGLRGAESDDDEEFCRRLAGRLGLPLIVGRAQGLAGGSASVEEAARQERYAFLGGAARQAGAGAVAIGHHAGDVAETVLMRMLRGSGIRGLGTMPPARALGAAYPDVRLVRPMLEATRAEILDFLHEAGQQYRIDRSNRDVGHVRNRVRHGLIPTLQREFATFSPGSLCALNESAREAHAFIEAALDREWPGLLRSTDRAGAALDAEAFRRLAPALQKEAVRRAVGLVDPEASRTLGALHLRSAARLGRGPVGGEVSLPAGLVARREHHLILVGRPGTAAGDSERVLPVPGRVELPGVGLTIWCELLAPGSVDPEAARARSSANEVYVNGTGIEGPLTVRFRRAGDRFQPLGAPGTMRLKQFFIDQRVPRHTRDRVPIIAAADGRIIWVVGLRMAHSFRLTDRGEPVMKLCAAASCAEAAR